jgi:hypothetical protein
METDPQVDETKLKLLMVDYFTLKLERLKAKSEEKIEEELLGLIKDVRSRFAEDIRSDLN